MGRQDQLGLGLGLVEIFFVSVQLYVLCLVKEHCDNDMAGGMTWHAVIMIWYVALAPVA